MNWGYARTLEGFVHAFTRGQYEKANPTIVPERFLTQLSMLKEGAMEEFTPLLLLVAITVRWPWTIAGPIVVLVAWTALAAIVKALRIRRARVRRA